VRNMKLFVLVAAIFAVLVIGCSVPDESTTGRPSNDPTANNPAANDATADSPTANDATADNATATGPENAGTAAATESP